MLSSETQRSYGTLLQKGTKVYLGTFKASQFNSVYIGDSNVFHCFTPAVSLQLPFTEVKGSGTILIQTAAFFTTTAGLAECRGGAKE